MSNSRIMAESDQTLLQYGDQEKHEPVDKGQLVYLIFILLGTGVLVPFNTFITAFDFFKEIFPTQPFEFWFSLTNNGPCFVTSLAMIPFGAYLSNSTRILSSYIAYFIIVVAVPFIGMAMNNGSISQKTAQDLVLSGVAIGGFFTGIVLPSVCGLAALFPASYIGATMSGVGVGGLIVGIIRVVTKISLPNNPDGVRTGSYIYFFIGAFLMLLCILGFFALGRVPYGRYHLRKAAQTTVIDTSAGTPEEQLISVPPASDDDNDGDDSPPLPAMAVFKKMWLQSVMVVLTFFITLSLFPGVFGLIKSNKESLNSSGWFGIILIVRIRSPITPLPLLGRLLSLSLSLSLSHQFHQCHAPFSSRCYSASSLPVISLDEQLPVSLFYSTLATFGPWASSAWSSSLCIS
eukprot:TRINITY_DN367_c0_g1_i3.p1 TRINITY_DN367_c0_g1~~TRINITY_DN367_c0_g1_i3.p1  ORF type:complete len:404 (+),score=89.65 TRINITY_DN367_c0_g1_i3:287-1498(+)